jgi:hypothetical protein
MSTHLCDRECEMRYRLDSLEDWNASEINRERERKMHGIHWGLQLEGSVVSIQRRTPIVFLNLAHLSELVRRQSDAYSRSS